jgi:hypothetical protein
MSTTASEAPPPLAAPNGEAEIQPVPVASPVRLSEPDQTEPESNNNVNNTDDGVNHDTTTTTEIDDPVPIPDDPTTTVAAAKSQKIMLVIGRKRKADDEMTTVSSELHTPPSHPSKTPELDPTSDPSVTTLPPVAEAPGGKQVNDTSAIITEQPPLNLPTKGPERSSTPATTTPKAVELPKRAPRKRRKWLRKGEVDPEDLKAVAEQRARHALIDAALEDLDKQEQMLLDGVHPQLLALWEECDRRRDIQISYSQSHEEYEMGELDHLYLQELGQIRCQFKVSF